MATDNRNAQTDMNDSTHVNGVVDDSLQATSTTPKPSVDTHSNTTAALATNVLALPSTFADLLVVSSGGNTAKFTDLPVEVLVTIADVLLDRYLATCPRDTLWQRDSSSWRDLDSCSGKNFDRSFFVARKLNQAMRYATRRAFFRNDPWLMDQKWATLGIYAMEHRVILEEKLAHLLDIETMRLRATFEIADNTAQHNLRRGFDKNAEYKGTMHTLYKHFDFKLLCDQGMLLKHKGSEPLELSTGIEDGYW